MFQGQASAVGKEARMDIIIQVLIRGQVAEVEPASGPSVPGLRIMEPLDTDPYYSKMSSATSKMKIAIIVMLSYGPKQSEMHQCLALTQK